MSENYPLNTKIKIVRIFNTYGENMSADDGRVISNFITQALNNKNITIYGDGKQTRSFCYVSDLIEGLILMMNSSDDITGPYNLGNPQEYTILEVAKKIIELTKSKSKIVYMPLPNDDPSVRQPDIFYVQRKLNWTPKISFIDGLKKTIDFYKNL